ncbi:MAG: hypothetical protein LC637_10155 [Xanthomonadaceae bacterium]|nr:hypothetical protein [Xanthomonadaceae bacterium]
MNAPESAALPHPGTATWVLLQWDDHRIALPSADVERIEQAGGLRAALPREAAAAWLADGDRPIPVYRLGEGLRPGSWSGTTGFVLIGQHENANWGLWGDGVRILAADEQPRGTTWPAVFARRRPPIEGIGLLVDGLPVMISRAALIGPWLAAHWARGGKP